MKGLVLGGYGTQGSVICRELTKHPKVSEVMCAGRSFERAKCFVDRFGNQKISALQVDLSKLDELQSALKGVDIVINAVSWKYNLKIMKICIENRISYQDLALGYSFEDKEMLMEDALEAELGLTEKFKETDGTALINTGMDPGISNIIAGHCADKIDHIYEIRIRDCDVLKTKEPITTWSPYLLWQDMIRKPLVYKDGRFVRLEPFSEEETYVFPDPIGPQPCYQHAHEEVVTIPRFIKDLRYVEFKMCGPDMPFAKTLYDYGLAKTEPIEVKDAKISPLDVFLALTPAPLSIEEVEERINDGRLIDEIACLLLDIKGEKDGFEANYTYYVLMTLKETNERMRGTTATSYLTGIGAEVFTELWVEGKIKTRGVAPAEALTPEERIALIKRLAEKGIRIYEVVSRPLQ